jgi:hypothetical protein
MARRLNLDKKVVMEIRNLYNGGEVTQVGLALRFGISQSTVCKIVNNYIHRNHDCVALCGSADVKLGLKYGNQK